MIDAQGARCALHFDVPSAAPCSRCGRFCCQSCLVEQNPPLCAACAPTVTDPFGLHAAGFDFVPAFVIAARLVWAELPKLLVLVVLFAIPAALLQVGMVGTGDDLKTISSSIRLGNLYDAFVGLIGAQAMLALLIARSEGRSLSLGGALGEGLGNWGRSLNARIRAGLWILLFAVLLIVPAFWKGTMLMFASVAALRTQDRDPLQVSEMLVRGRFGLCLGFGLLAVGVCYVPMFITLTLVSLVFEQFGLPRLGEELITDVLQRFSVDVMMTSLLYVAFVMLHRNAGEVLDPMRWRKTPALRAP